MGFTSHYFLFQTFILATLLDTPPWSMGVTGTVEVVLMKQVLSVLWTEDWSWLAAQWYFHDDEHSDDAKCEDVTMQKQPRWKLHTGKTWRNVLHGHILSGRGGYKGGTGSMCHVSSWVDDGLAENEAKLPLCGFSPGCGMPDVLKESNLIKPGQA